LAQTVVERIEVGLHHGNSLQYLSQAYGNGPEVLREACQNCLDKSATNIFIKIDCEKSTITVFDNGTGADREEIGRKFANVSLSLKIGIDGMRGQKGIGNLAAFSVGTLWRLTTRKKGTNGSLRSYTLDSEELRKGSGLEVQVTNANQKVLEGAPFKANTVLEITGVGKTALRQLGDREGIERVMQEAFNATLLKGGVLVQVLYKGPKQQRQRYEVKPLRFRGRKMDSEVYETKYGPVTFEFYHLPEPSKTPNILVLHNGVYSIPLGNFFKLGILSKELNNAFMEGHFEGEIRLGFCKLNPQRTAFEHDDHLSTFVSTVEEFGEQILKPIVAQFKESDREGRLKKVLESAVKKMKQFLEKNPNLMPANMKNLSSGGDESPEDVFSVSVGKKKRELSPDALKKQREVSRSGEKKPRNKPVAETRDGLGVQFVNPEAEEGFLWHSRLSKGGIIQINSMHRDFSEAELRGNTVTSRYVFLLMHKELTCASLNPHEAQVFGNAFERTFLEYARVSLFE